MSTWFVCRVVSRQEKRVLAAFEEKGITAYCPMERKWSLHARPKVAISRALFPGYVFAVMPNDHALDAARSDRRVRDIMCDKFGTPIIASTRSLRGIFIADMFHEFDHTYVAPKVKGKKYSHKWAAGQQVKVIRGPLEGFIGRVIRAKGKARFELLLNVFGREQEVNVSHSELETYQAQNIAPSLAA
ncbi:MAG: transcription termination/antitermination NusG family protein [Phenylobacterium sp.]|uniref:transcription termination/antitermination protein NusG n=1 Tax=Phenylobacterium sp. TaxID=1871053 RepID=UPI0027230BD0|nr:transcription termination/antitermination NusG family protein [Phenylobacterium sp.]MDO8912314.1 transcription termination/antitermination NusG family protein [Phenylobacterium sp.]MDP3099526.1 transcription termination/antitermination NusG family protein [Phenylobacterium sp.]